MVEVRGANVVLELLWTALAVATGSAAVLLLSTMRPGYGPAERSALVLTVLALSLATARAHRRAVRSR